MDRRNFLKMSGIGLSFTSLSNLTQNVPLLNQLKVGEMASLTKPGPYKKYLNANAKVGDLTESAKSMAGRDSLLKKALDKIPSPERVEQIFNVIHKHIEAEEDAHVDRTMATLSDDVIFEEVNAGTVIKGHVNVRSDYKTRYDGLTRTLHITNLNITKDGAFAELLWEGKQTGRYRGLRPSLGADSFFLPMVIYYQVNEQGLICRESVYFDQYLGYLSLDVLSFDILQNQLLLGTLNPDLLRRKL